MRILLTNDDGYRSEGLLLLRKVLEKYGEVFTVAPERVQSGKSVSLTIRQKMPYRKLDDRYYCLDGSPADCVIFGICHVPDIDLVVSGCNDGYNLGTDTLYSGTCGACIQGLIGGIPGIAFSCKSKDYFFQIEAIAGKVFDCILKKGWLSSRGFLNVNFPERETEKGILLTELFVRKIRYRTEEETAGSFLSQREMETTSDIRFDDGAVRAGYVSVTPLKGDYSCAGFWTESGEVRR